ncbi:hypothetical protein, partial [Pseudemcibacter sp.]|uniref:hypothetical protein n=1 Tax=Pseudemcibacter sp. TaxID=2943293 RepID=UPI003F6A216F
STPFDLSSAGPLGSTEWFATMTGKINKLKIVEDKMSVDIQNMRLMHLTRPLINFGLYWPC